ncbi:MAG: PQQ-dependent sugar dehydrogenase [Cyclobacteriaceae bacterium]|nr:PQQ-dependent sugar dehydrogenase [Cyclobacteriaceae bacterium]
MTGKENTDPAKFSFRVDTIATGLLNPWALAFLPNEDLLVTERAGQIRVIRDNKLLETKISGVPGVYANGQGGLFEVILHPDYSTNGWLYISYSATRNGGSNTAVIRAKLDGFDLVEREVIFQALPFLSGGQHFGGSMEFDQNGNFYLSVGERGRRDNAQTLDNHAGKIIRLNADGSIPADNPFVDKNRARPEIYTYGNRNPQGMARHPDTGEIWTHEHGPMGGDEINIVKPGVNYGWPVVSYGDNYDGSTISEKPTAEGIIDPLHYWDPSIAPCGMTFVTSDLFSPWKGNLLVGSLKFRYLARLELNGNEVTSEEKLLEGLGRVRSVIEGPDGLIYVSVESPGMVLRLTPVSD